MNKGKIVFFGTPDFAVPSLKALVNAGYDVAAVVTATDKPAGRGHRLLPSAVKTCALEHNIPVLQPEKLRDPEFIDTLRAIHADLFIVIAFRMLPEIVWAMPPLGTFNLHGSLLPAYRGAAPINWAIINGEKRTGVTTFFLSHEIDTGDIIDQRSIDIADDENVGSVYDRLMTLGAELTLSTTKAIFDGTVTTIPQRKLIEEGITPSPAPKIFRETCRIDWNQPARNVVNFIRGLSPYPCATTTLSVNGENAEVKILKAHTNADSIYSCCQGSEPGTVSIADSKAYGQFPAEHELRIATTDRYVIVDLLQIPGKKPLTPADLRNGRISLATPK